MAGEAYFDFDLNFGNVSMPRRLRITQYGDQLPVFRAKLYNMGTAYGIPEGSTVNVRWKKPSGTAVYNPVTSFDGNTITYALDGQCLAVEGLCTACFEITSAEKTIQTPVFSVEVVKNPVQQDDIEDSPEFDALDKALQETIDTAKAETDKIVQAAGEQAQAGFDNAVQRVTDTANTAVNQIDTTSQNAVNQVESAAQTAASQAQDAFDNAVEQAKVQTEQIASASAEQAKQYAAAAGVSANLSASSATKAEEAAKRAEAAAPEGGAVISVNGMGGIVQLDAEDVPFDNTGTPFVSTTVQAAIEELLSIGGGGGGTTISTITVTAPAGAVVTLSQGAKSYTQTVGEDGAALTFRVLETGLWNVVAVLDGAQDTGSINVTEAGGSYSLVLDFAPYKAYIKVTGPDGAAVNVTKSGKSVFGTISGGSVTLTVSEGGKWFVAATYKDGIAQSTSVDVLEEQATYTAEAKFCTLTVTAPAGSTVEIKNGVATLTGTADSGSVKFWLPNTGTWTVKATLGEQTANGRIDCAAYQDYSTELAYFSATIKAAAVDGATVKAVMGDYSVSGNAGTDGTATLTVLKPGNYTVGASYSGADSNSKSVDVSESGKEYPVSVEFITLTVTAPEGSTITVKNNTTELTNTGGTVKFYLPNTGTWSVTAELNGQTASDSVECYAYQAYSTSLSYFSATIKVTAVQGAAVKAVLDGYTVSGEAGSGGVVTLTVLHPGNYTVSATYKNALSNSKAVQVSQSGQEYPVSVDFITLTVTAPAGSTITAKNGATTLTDTGGTVKFYLPNTGTWTVSASLGGDSASSEVQCIAYQNYPVELSYGPGTLDEMTWAEVAELSAAGTLSDYFDVGDGKKIVLNGAYDHDDQENYPVIQNLEVVVFILGFNHNAAIEGQNITHWQIGKIGTKLISFYDNSNGPYAGIYTFCMNPMGTQNGWKYSDLRTNLGSTSKPTSSDYHTFYAFLPNDLKAVMRSAKKYDVEGNSNDHVISNAPDYISIASEFEVFGKITKSATEEKNYQKQYQYYAAGNPKYSYLFDASNNKCIQILRSIDVTDLNTANYCAISQNGTITTVYANDYTCCFSPIIFV